MAWRRGFDPATGRLKHFGLAEFSTVEAAARCLRVFRGRAAKTERENGDSGEGDGVLIAGKRVEVGSGH